MISHLGWQERSIQGTWLIDYSWPSAKVAAFQEEAMNYSGILYMAVFCNSLLAADCSRSRPETRSQSGPPSSILGPSG